MFPELAIWYLITNWCARPLERLFLSLRAFLSFSSFFVWDWGLLVLSLSTRTPILTTRGKHHTWQSPGEICPLRRIRTACGRLPGSPLCQAPSWLPEVCSTTACRSLEFREECHLLPSYVSHWTDLGPLSLRKYVSQWCRKESKQLSHLLYIALESFRNTIEWIISEP